MQTECIELTLHRFVIALQNPELQLLIARQMNNAQTVSRKSCHHRNGQLHLNKWAFLATASASAVAAQPADLAGSQPDVEAIAGSLPHRLSEEHILRLLGRLPNDGAVRGPSHSEVHCFTVGAYCHGERIVGIRNTTHRFGKVSSVLARFVRHRFRNDRFAAIGLFQGQCTSLHSESYNLVMPLSQGSPEADSGLKILKALPSDLTLTATCLARCLSCPQASSLQGSTALFHGPSS